MARRTRESGRYNHKSATQVLISELLEADRNEYEAPHRPVLSRRLT